jgi:methionine-rich copper-binding protein CopC
MRRFSLILVIAATVICFSQHALGQPLLTITEPTDRDTLDTATAQISLSGSATAQSGRQIVRVVWDNVNTDEAGIVTISPSTTLTWGIDPIRLKPGKNEVFFTATDSVGEVGTDRIIVNRSFARPVISNISIAQTEVRVYEKFEIRFDVETVTENPYFVYDETPPPGITPGIGITVEGVFTSPSGEVLRQPGFFYREVTRTGSGGQTHYEETARTYWMVRLSPLETGNYIVSLRVQDGSGSTEVAAGNFTALPPVRRGFIQVSSDDPRYFELTNGDIFLPTGPASGPDYASYQGTGINLERVWMAGQAAYSTNFARWMRIDRVLGNEGFSNSLEFRRQYPGHDLCQKIGYPNSHRIWMGSWLDNAFYPNLKPNTEYLIKFRLRTFDIAGPVNPSYPYGFMLKTHGWPTENLEQDLRSHPSMIPVINQNRDWHTVVARYTTTQRDGDNQFMSFYLDNVSDGSVDIDQFSIKEILPDGSYGGELIRHSKADIHTYVEQRPAAYFDWQVEQGEQCGVFFKYVIQDKNDWVPNHLVRDGSFQDAGDGYFQEDGTKAKWLQQQWWRYLIARWGYSTAIHSWELCNEADPDDGRVYRQTQDLARFMHQNDSHPHLVTTSFWSGWRPNFWRDRTNYPDVDYADLHRYTNEEVLGLDMAEFILSLAESTNEPPVGIPVMLGETGIGHPGQNQFEHLRQPNTGVWYHNMLWAQLNSGSGISSSNYWWSDHLNVINRQQISTPFHQFVRDLNINRGGYVDLSATVTNSQIRVLGQKNTSQDKAYLWVQNKLHNWHNVMEVENPVPITPQSGTVTIRMSPNTSFSVERWNTYTGESQSLGTLQSDANGDITISVVELSDDFAVKLNSPPRPPQNLRILP